MPKKDFHYIYLSVILIDSVLKKDKNYYSQVFLEECKYIKKGKKKRCKDELKIYFDDSDKEIPDKESFDI